MALEAGTRLGRYEIEQPAGAGGMGEVYRARDTRLERIVAIKVLPDAMAADPHWQARLEREAKSVSALNHPRICALYDVGHEPNAGASDAGVHFLVMEYLEGETLADRILREPPAQSEALEIAEQIADALAVAHRQGLVHRDLKPGNVMLTKTGAKLLDFGLAKPNSAGSSSSSFTVATATSPLQATSPLTAEGTVIGTFQYLAPEVLEGGEADARSDIFAFGAVLFEMLTGRRAFDGKSQASVVASILKEQIRPVSQIATTTPPALDRIVQRCLEKDPDERWQSARDLARELNWIASGNSGAFPVQEPTSTPAGSVVESARSAGSSRTGWWVAGLLAIVTIALGSIALRPPSDVASPETVRFEIPPPGGLVFRSMEEAAAPPEVSPDGRHIVFGVMDHDGGSPIWLRSLDDVAPRPIPGTEGGMRPFWSADSRSIGFFFHDEMRKVDIQGGPPITICATSGNARGATWAADGTIVVAPGAADGLYRVRADGGELLPVTELDPARETSHRYPSFLPDGRHFTYLSLAASGATGTGSESENRLMLGSLDRADPRLLVEGASQGILSDGWLVFRRGEALLAQRFDDASLTLEGDFVTVAGAVHYDAAYERGIFSVGGGTLAFIPGSFRGETEQHLVEVPDFEVTKIEASGVLTGHASISPDGRTTASSQVKGDAEAIWLHDIERGLWTRLSFEDGVQGAPIWSPDGRRVAYGSNDGAGWSTWVQDVHGRGTSRQLVDESADAFPMDWSPDGRYLLLLRWDAKELFLLDLESDEPPRSLRAAPHALSLARFSPDGKWLAYTTAETGAYEIMLTRFPSLEGKWLVSSGGGMDPAWYPDGERLIYRGLNNHVVEVPIVFDGGSPQIGAPRNLFPLFSTTDAEVRALDISRDGRRILTTGFNPDDLRIPITVVRGWSAGL